MASVQQWESSGAGIAGEALWQSWWSTEGTGGVQRRTYSGMREKGEEETSEEKGAAGRDCLSQPCIAITSPGEW